MVSRASLTSVSSLFAAKSISRGCCNISAGGLSSRSKLISYHGRQHALLWRSSTRALSSINYHSTVTDIYRDNLHLHARNCHEESAIKFSKRSLFFGRSSKYKQPWHDPNFMADSTPEEVETWLLSLMQTARRKADASGIVTNDSSINQPIVYFDKEFDIDAIAYLRVLEAYARSSNVSGSPQKGEYWVGVLERHYDAAMKLFTDTFGHHADSTSQIPNQNASSVHSKQLDMAASIVRNLQPTVDCYNILIELWGNNNKDLISVVRSRRWLTKLEDEAKDAQQNSSSSNESILYTPLSPNAKSYDLYLHSCSRGLGKQHKLHKERALECEEILQYRLSDEAPLSIRPTTESFNYVLRAWTRCRKEESVATKVMNLVLMMERIQKEYLMAAEKGENVRRDDEWSWKAHVAPNTKTYTTAMDGWIIKASLKANKWRAKQLRINERNEKRARYGHMNKQPHNDNRAEENSCGDGTKEMEKAETILKYIKDLNYVGSADVDATVVGYNTLLSGWARLANELRPDVPLKSEKLLHDMIAMAQEGNENASPDVISFNAVIKAWGRTKRQNSADRCEYWLRKMIDANRSDKIKDNGGEKNFIVKPNVATYNLCMDAHFELGDAPRVQDMLLEMDATNGQVSPNSVSFSKVIRAWLNDELNNDKVGLPGSSLENGWRNMEELLKREKKGSGNNDLGPAPELFTSILKTAATTVSMGLVFFAYHTEHCISCTHF